MLVYEQRLREIRIEGRMVKLEVLGRIWKYPDGMHRLAARGLPPGVDADIITRFDETNVEELGVMSCFSTLIVVKYVG